MHRLTSFVSSVLSVLFLVPASVPVAIAAETGTAPQGAVKVEQISASSLGSWTLLFEDGSAISSKDPGVNKTSYSFGLTVFGQTTLQITPPPGMSTKLNIYRGEELLETITTPQYSFRLYPNSNYRFVIQYALSRLGSIGITSTPSGIRFRMKGPTRRTYSAVTPHTFKNLPAGKYSVIVGSTPECTKPAPQSANVEPEKRMALQITLGCNQVEEVAVDRTRPTKRTLTNYAEEREYKGRGERK